LIFDTGDDPLRKVPTMDPTRGTRARVGQLLDECPDAAGLVKRLSA
jgi:proteasome accessory factor A